MLLKKSIDKNNLAYIIGIAIGDGNLSNPNKRAIRLRITCDAKYKKLIKNIASAIQKLMPDNKVSIMNRKDNCVDISCYSNKWKKFLGWKAENGPKHKQNISIPKWIKNNKKFTLSCLKGLFETDGSVYFDRKYKMVNFVTIIPKLAEDVMKMITKIGFKANMQLRYEHKNIKHTIRISKNTKKFIELVNINKE